MKQDGAQDYLWDGSGEPDAFVRQLEMVLARFRYARAVPLGAQDDRHDLDIDGKGD